MPSVRFVFHHGVPVTPDAAAGLRADEAEAMAVEADVLAGELAEAELLAAQPEPVPPEPVPLEPPDFDVLLPEPPEPEPEPLLPPDPVPEPGAVEPPLIETEPADLPAVLTDFVEPDRFGPELLERGVLPGAEGFEAGPVEPESIEDRLFGPEPVPPADPPQTALITDLLPAARPRFRRRRPRHRRQGWGPPVAVTLVLAAVLAGLGVWLVSRPGPGTARPEPGDRQRTLLLMLRDGDDLRAAALLGIRAQDGVAVLVSAQLVLEVPGIGRQPLDTAFATKQSSPAVALSDALGVRIDGTWVLSTAGLGAMVDAVGGVSVDVDEDLSWHGTDLAGGSGQHLNGAAAVAFASVEVAGEPEESHLARFNSVLTQLLAGLQQDDRTVGKQLSALGKESTTTLPGDRLGSIVSAARTLARGEGWQGVVLPIRVSEAGGARVQGLDTEQAEVLVAQQLAGARIPEPAQGVIRVLVRNGVGAPRLSEAARDRLVASNLRFVAGGNADSFGRRTTIVLVASASRTDRERGILVARALRVSPSSIQVDPLGSAMADVVVVLGKDFADDVARRSVRG